MKLIIEILVKEKVLECLEYFKINEKLLWRRLIYVKVIPKNSKFDTLNSYLIKTESSLVWELFSR